MSTNPSIDLASLPVRDDPPANRAERRHPSRPTSQEGAARYFQCSTKTIERWLDRGYITGWRDGKAVLVDVDEIERELKNNSHMRDGRRSRYSSEARILPLPKVADQ